MNIITVSYRKYKELISSIESWPVAYGRGGQLLRDKMYTEYNISYTKVSPDGYSGVKLFFDSEQDMIWFELKYL